MNDKKEIKNFVSIREASRLTGLGNQTIRKMADDGTLRCYKTPAGQRRIDIQSIQELCSTVSNVSKELTFSKKNFIYARVSTKKQVDDLSRQLDFLQQPQFTGYTVVTDIASGINFKRKGLETILESCLQRNIGEIVVAHKDRLCRFGYELIEQLVIKAGGKITVLGDNGNNKSDEQELTDDLLAIIHVFSCRQMGKRSYANRKPKDIESKDLPHKEPESNT